MDTELLTSLLRLQARATESASALVAAVSEHPNPPDEERPGLRRAYSLLHEIVAELEARIEGPLA